MLRLVKRWFGLGDGRGLVDGVVYLVGRMFYFIYGLNKWVVLDVYMVVDIIDVDWVLRR